MKGSGSKNRPNQGFDDLRFGMKNRVGGKRDKEISVAWETETRERGRPQWLVFGGIVAVVLLGIGVILVMRFRHTGPNAAGMTDSQVGKRIGNVSNEPFDAGGAKDWKGPVPWRIAEGFTKATTDEERLKWVRDPERAAPLMTAFFHDGHGATEKILGVTSMGPASNGKFSFQRFQVRMEDGSKRMLCVVLTDNGGKIDFESYARHGSATWKDLLCGNAPEAEEVRVFVEPGFTFVHGFSDEKKWRCFVATTPDWADPLDFYTLRESEADKALRSLMNGGGPIRVILAIRSVGDSYQKRQFEVTKVVAGGWVR